MFPLVDFNGTKGKDVGACFTLWRYVAPCDDNVRCGDLPTYKLRLPIFTLSKRFVVRCGKAVTFFGPEEDFINNWWKSKIPNVSNKVQVLPLSNSISPFSLQSTQQDQDVMCCARAALIQLQVSTMYTLPEGSIGS